MRFRFSNFTFALIDIQLNITSRSPKPPAITIIVGFADNCDFISIVAAVFFLPHYSYNCKSMLAAVLPALHKTINKSRLRTPCRPCAAVGPTCGARLCMRGIATVWAVNKVLCRSSMIFK